MHPFFTLNGKEQNHNNLACCKKYLGQQPVDLIFLTTESANQLHSVVAIEVEGNKSQALQSKKEGAYVCAFLCSYNGQYRMDGIAMEKNHLSHQV